MNLSSAVSLLREQNHSTTAEIKMQQFTDCATTKL